MIRDYRPEDRDALVTIHAEMGLDYQFPDLNSPLFLVKKVREVDGRVTDAMLLRISAETYLLTAGGPKEKMAAMEELQPAVLREAWIKGLDDVYAVIPPGIIERFRKRLKQLGWAKDRPWEMWSRGTNA